MWGLVSVGTKKTPLFFLKKIFVSVTNKPYQRGLSNKKIMSKKKKKFFFIKQGAKKKKTAQNTKNTTRQNWITTQRIELNAGVVVKQGQHAHAHSLHHTCARAYSHQCQKTILCHHQLNGRKSEVEPEMGVSHLYYHLRPHVNQILTIYSQHNACFFFAPLPLTHFHNGTQTPLLPFALVSRSLRKQPKAFEGCFR